MSFLRIELPARHRRASSIRLSTEDEDQTSSDLALRALLDGLPIVRGRAGRGAGEPCQGSGGAAPGGSPSLVARHGGGGGEAL